MDAAYTMMKELPDVQVSDTTGVASSNLPVKQKFALSKYNQF